MKAVSCFLFLSVAIWNILFPLGGAATEIQEMCMAEVAVQAEEASGRGLLPHGSTL